MHLFRNLVLLLASLGSATSNDNSQGLEGLTLYLVNKAFRHEEAFPRAIEVLEKLKSSPSCSRLSIQGLITECESLELSSMVELDLEDVKEQYAARLAICEVTAAGVAPPEECRIFVPSNGRNRQACDSPPCFEHPPRSQMKACLSALHKENQLWTSFSNSLQNVVHVCQAARIWVERDELIHIHQQGVRLQENLTTRLDTCLEEGLAFATSVQALQLQVQDEIQTQILQTRSAFGQMVSEISASLDDVLRRVGHGSNLAGQHATSLIEKLHNASARIGAFGMVLQRLNENTSRIVDTMADADEKGVNLWLHLQAMIEAVARSTLDANELQVVLSNASALISNSMIALRTGLDHYNKSIDTIDGRVSTTLSNIDSIGLSTSQPFLLVLQVVNTYLLLSQSDKSRKSLLVVFLAIVGIVSYIPKCVRAFGLSIAKTALFAMVPATIFEYLAIPDISLWVILSALGMVVIIVVLFRASFVKYHGRWLPRADVPGNLQMQRYVV